MKRRDFVKTSAGFLAFMTIPGCYLVSNTKKSSRIYKFRDYQKDTSVGRVKIVTPDDVMRFCMFHYTGEDFKILTTKTRGSGHPSVNADTSYLISDYYAHVYKRLGHDECPIRLIDLNNGEEVSICKVYTDLDISESTFRIDPHPVWSPDHKKVCFNGAPNGVRQVFVADLSDVIQTCKNIPL